MAPAGALDLDKFPKLKAYYERILETAAVKAAYARLTSK